MECCAFQNDATRFFCHIGYRKIKYYVQSYSGTLCALHRSIITRMENGRVALWQNAPHTSGGILVWEVCKEVKL